MWWFFDDVFDDEFVVDVDCCIFVWIVDMVDVESSVVCVYLVGGVYCSVVCRW